MIAIWIASAVAVIIFIVGVTLFNRLIRFKNTVKSAWSDIDVQLKKRHDLIPNLLETVKSYSAYEKNVFENITRARSAAMSGIAPGGRAEAEQTLSGLLRGLFAVAEAYPDLKANQNYLALQSQLTQVEGDIEHARRYYNAVVRDFNTAIESFPSNLIAAAFVFKQAEMFELGQVEKEKSPSIHFQ